MQRRLKSYNHDAHLNYFNRNGRENHVWLLFKDMPDKFDNTFDIWKKTLLKRAWIHDDWYIKLCIKLKLLSIGTIITKMRLKY